MLTMLAKLLKALNSESAPGQVALAFALAVIAGLTPLFSLHNLLVLLLAFIIRVNLSAFFLGVAFFSGVAYLTDPWAIRLGESVLQQPALIGLWTEWYQSDFWRLTAFNNTLVMGSLLLSLLAFVPVLVVSRLLIVMYRDKLLAWIEKLKVVQVLKASKFVNVYKSLAD